MPKEELKIINLATEFSRFPGGRVRSDGDYSGEAFREDHLIPALKEYAQVRVIIDEGVVGYGSSFLEECFGGLKRQGYSPEDLRKVLSISYSDPAYSMYEKEIWEYIEAK